MLTHLFFGAKTEPTDETAVSRRHRFRGGRSTLEHVMSDDRLGSRFERAMVASEATFDAVVVPAIQLVD